MEKETNYMQIGEGHCWKCHQTYQQIHDCPCIDLSPTACNMLTCGKWYQERERSLSTITQDNK